MLLFLSKTFTFLIKICYFIVQTIGMAYHNTMNRNEAIEKLQDIIGEDLVELAQQYGITLFKNTNKNKGWVGHIVEHHLGLPINSLQSPDFGDWELKTVSMKKLKSGIIVPKETMAITMINAEHVINTDFEQSHLKSKLDKLLVISRMWYATTEPKSELLDAFLFNIETDVELYEEIKADYEETRECLKTKGFSCLTGKMGKWIQPRTKGQGNGAPITRAFYARTSFVKKIMKLEN